MGKLRIAPVLLQKGSTRVGGVLWGAAQLCLRLVLSLPHSVVAPMQFS